MQLNSLSIGRKAIKFNVTMNAGNTDESVPTEERSVTAHEAPLDSLPAAFGQLPPVFCKILELPAEWATGLSITKILISRTKLGTRSVKFWGKKQLETRRDFLHLVTTPVIQIDNPADGESGEIQLNDKAMIDLILVAIHEAEQYAGGKRSQKLLDFDEAKAALNATADVGQQHLAGV